MSNITLTFESGESSLSVRSFRTREIVSELFSVSVWARSPESAIDLDALVGKRAALYVEGPYGGRRWTGICDLAEQVQAETTGLSTYHVHIVPELWLLGQRRNLRIFQHLSAPDIVALLLAEWGIEPVWELSRASYPKLEYKVQYDESDLSFASRILEEAGVAFVFDEEADKGSVLTFSDKLHGRDLKPRSPVIYTDNPSRSADVEFISQLRISHEVRPGAHTIRDYDFRNPGYPLVARSTGDKASAQREQYRYQPGAFSIEVDKSSGNTPFADDQSIARPDEAFGQARADRGLSTDRLGHTMVSFGGNSPDVKPGVVFSITGHPSAEIDDESRLLVIETIGEGSVEGAWSVSGKAVFATEPFFPARKAPRPTIHGVASATVVGPAGQEIYTDEYGRVRVLFPWDRGGAAPGKSTCWVRVSQGWAGTGFGIITVPRVGQEVLVGFLEGDPEQPIVVGRVYNGKNRVPYKLPEKKTVSGWRTESTPGGGGYNEIVFDDAKNNELLGVRAERDLRALVRRDSTSTVGRHRRRLVKGHEREVTLGDHTVYVAGDRKELVLGDSIEQVEGDACEQVTGDDHLLVTKERREVVTNDVHEHVHGERRTRVDGKLSLTVLGERHEKVAKAYALETKGELHVKADQAIVIEAQDLTLKGPGGFIRIDPGGVTIKGTLVKINSAGGSAGKGSGAKPDEPKEIEKVEVKIPEVDDVGQTGHGP